MALCSGMAAQRLSTSRPSGLRAALPLRRRAPLRVAAIAAPAEEMLGAAPATQQEKFEVRERPWGRPARRPGFGPWASQEPSHGARPPMHWFHAPPRRLAASRSPAALPDPLAPTICRAAASWPTPLPSPCKTFATPSPPSASRRTPPAPLVRPGLGRVQGCSAARMRPARQICTPTNPPRLPSPPLPTAYLALDVGIVAALAIAAYNIDFPLLWPLYWFAQGTMFWALFVVGHDW